MSRLHGAALQHSPLGALSLGFCVGARATVRERVDKVCPDIDKVQETLVGARLADTGGASLGEVLVLAH